MLSDLIHPAIAAPRTPPSRSLLSALIVGTAMALAAISAGCQSAHVSNYVTTQFSGDDADDQLNFWHELATRRLTSNDDAFHGLLLDIDGSDKSADYAQRVQTLKSRGLLPGSFAQPPDMAIERGTLALAIVKQLHLRGGWEMHVFGVSPRYAVKELVYAGIFPPSSPQQTFSGSEFVGIIGKLDDMQPVASNTPAQ
ncbi:MAG: hypothetical protein M3O30_01135 [Planctomycetota bacterium]|nr:hypothetical protein [Planctomycetota bacterium]